MFLSVSVRAIDRRSGSIAVKDVRFSSDAGLDVGVPDHPDPVPTGKLDEQLQLHGTESAAGERDRARSARDEDACQGEKSMDNQHCTFLRIRIYQ